MRIFRSRWYHRWCYGSTKRKWRSIMAAIDSLEVAVADNTAAVNAAVAKIDVLIAGQVASPDEARVQAAANQVAADAARLAIKSV